MQRGKDNYQKELQGSGKAKSKLIENLNQITGLPRSLNQKQSS